MLDRYRGDHAHAVFNPQAVINRWMDTTRWYAVDAAKTANDQDAVERLKLMVTPPAGVVEAQERLTGHDVVAFLEVVESATPQSCRKYLHYGLTSSDIVDNALFAGIAEFTERLNRGPVNALVLELTEMATDMVPRLGRTHGQFAEPTTLDWKPRIWLSTLYSICTTLRTVPLIKTPGATGHMWIRTALDPGDKGRTVASTQVIPRDHLLSWAMSMLRLATLAEDIALEVRLGARAEVGEVREGAGRRRAGSSAMPHKNNPIQSEQISGMARLARGYFNAIAENCVLHNDRDISNSSVERVAVVDLAHIVEAMITRIGRVLIEAEWDHHRIKENLADHWHEATTSFMQAALQASADLGPVEASKVIREAIKDKVPEDWAGAIGQWVNIERGGDALVQYWNAYDRFCRNAGL